jgi:hypothetical protein
MIYRNLPVKNSCDFPVKLLSLSRRHLDGFGGVNRWGCPNYGDTPNLFHGKSLEKMDDN